MRKLFSILVAVLLTASVFAQSPQKMSYQAVIRNISNTLVTNATVGMRISIIQGSATGAVVYTETQTPTTNANGLVSIEIGGGIGFDAINWAAGSFFIITETDPTGGTNYTIVGTSQLLSVPYALYAKLSGSSGDPAILFDNTQVLTNKTWTSDKINTELSGKVDKVTGKGLSTEDYTTAEKIKLAGIAEGAEVNIQADWNQTTNTADDYIKNKPTIPSAADGSETKLLEGTNVTITGSGTTASPYVVNATGATILTIGQAYQGGIIFWLDATGQHGLIAATADQSTGIQWANGINRYTGTTGDGLYAGSMNTAMIVATQMADNQTGNFAAKICADYSVTVGDVTYGDWYLPSKYELNLLYQQKLVVGGFTNEMYWSSTEYGPNNSACYHMFGSGFQSDGNKNYTGGKVRAIRSF